MSEKVSFIKALAGTCCGISIFRKLRFQSWLRTVLHVILLGILAALLITVGELKRKKPLFRASRSVFEQTFGDRILNTPAGFVPVKSPEKSRYISLPNNGRFWYLPAGKIDVPLNELEKNDFILFWAPRGFATALRKDGGSWTVSILKPGQERTAFSGAQVLSTSALQKTVLDSKEDWQIDDAIKSFTLDELSGAFYSIMTMGLMLQNFVLTIVLPVLYTGVFVGMFRLTSGGRFPVRLTFQEFWKIGFYAGFPPLLIASAFPALDLPFLSFSSVYMIGLLGYWLYTANRLERELFVFETGDDSNVSF